jgi:hypothetical protein
MKRERMKASPPPSPPPHPPAKSISVSRLGTTPTHLSTIHPILLIKKEQCLSIVVLIKSINIEGSKHRKRREQHLDLIKPRCRRY